MFVNFIRNHITKSSFKLLTRLLFVGVIVALTLGFVVLTLTVSWKLFLWFLWISYFSIGKNEMEWKKHDSLGSYLCQEVYSNNFICQWTPSFGLEFVLLRSPLFDLLCPCWFLLLLQKTHWSQTFCCNLFGSFRLFCQCHGQTFVGFGSCCLYYGCYGFIFSHHFLLQIYQRNSNSFFFLIGKFFSFKIIFFFFLFMKLKIFLD